MVSRKHLRVRNLSIPGCKPQYPNRSPQRVLALQWSINDFFQNLPNLEILQSTYTPTVIILQETRQQQRIWNELSVVCYSREHIYHTVAFGIAVELSLERVDPETDLPIITVRTTSHLCWSRRYICRTGSSMNPSCFSVMSTGI